VINKNPSQLRCPFSGPFDEDYKMTKKVSFIEKEII